MKINKDEYNKMQNTKRIINEMIKTGNMRKYNVISSVWLKEIINCYKQIVKSTEHSAETEFEDVAKFFVRCGFFVIKSISGKWRIYISLRSYDNTICEEKTRKVRNKTA